MQNFWSRGGGADGGRFRAGVGWAEGGKKCGGIGGCGGFADGEDESPVPRDASAIGGATGAVVCGGGGFYGAGFESGEERNEGSDGDCVAGVNPRRKAFLCGGRNEWAAGCFGCE